jgi:regulation of enolase protein 1 (concanavalin A-like superfamily)
VNWVQVGSSRTISMSQNVYIGLAVSANNNSALVTATFDNVSITVPVPDFALLASPGNLSIMQGASGTSTVTITPQNGFSGSVSLSASGVPSGVTASFSPNPTTATSTLTLAASGTATTGTATVAITGTSGSLTHTTTVNLTVNVAPNFPPGWLEADVGSVGTAGSASYANGAFTVKASGKWIWDVADGMHFVYQAFSGDGTIVARVVSAQGSVYPQAGVMIRETLATGSVHAHAAYQPYPGPSVYFYSRASSGGTTVAQGTAVSGLPYWVKLVRSGSTFSSYASANGVNWVQLGSSRTINMSQNVYIGLAVSANNNSALVTATFDNVSID